MDLKRLAAKNVMKAFETAKSLGVIATFAGGSAGGYDFSTNTAQTSAVAFDALVIPIAKRRDRDGNKVVSLMVQNVDIKAFASVTFDGETYKVGALTQDNGVIKVFDAVRGA